MKLLTLFLVVFVGGSPAFSQNSYEQRLLNLDAVFHKAKKRTLKRSAAVAQEQSSLWADNVSYKLFEKKKDAHAYPPPREIIECYERAKARGNLAGLASALVAGIGTLMVIKRTLGLPVSSSGNIAAETLLFVRNSALRLFAVGIGVGFGLYVRHRVTKYYLDKHLFS